jgi:hypothetical protein
MVKIVRQASQKCTLYKPLYCPKNGEHLIILINILIYIFIKQKKLKTKTILLGVTILLFFPLLIFYIRAVSLKIGSPLQFAFYSLFNRIFMISARVAMVHYMVFPDYINFLYRSSMNYISCFLGKELFPLSNYLYLYFYP